ncbi:MAG TPA: winged helix-turn-helix domain-containing protein [Nitrososphaeraceae archaeon]|nr:winged helix-turn-helix domain-containing protein [Nitrososphaeraceae archaeon]
MKNRVRTEMLETMLETAKGKTTKTKIMYSAFLSYSQLKDFDRNNLIGYLK